MTRSATAAALFAADPLALGGVIVRGGWGPHRDQWLAAVRSELTPGTPWVVIPVTVDQDRLDGGLDLAASLSAGRPVRSTGLIAAAAGGVAVIHRADRLRSSQVASLILALDEQRLAVIVLDDATGDDDPVPPALAERLAFAIEPETSETLGEVCSGGAPEAIRDQARRVAVPAAALSLLCRLAGGLGISSLRGPILALAVARLHAALAGQSEVGEADLTAAAELVLAPRARQIPPDRPPEEPSPREPSTPDSEQSGDQSNEPLEDRIDAAVKAALPPGLLEQLATAGRSRGAPGRAGDQAKDQRRGRCIGARAGDPRRGRLHLYATLLTAAPWQGLRRVVTEPPRLRVHKSDLRIKRLVHPVGATTVFAVDASGSAALHRLAEAKGAVEALLAESYVRRDQVALVVFRAADAAVILPPTRSLTRARRALAGLAGGGGTPLASGLALAHEIAIRAARAGSRPILVILTDGRANIDAQGRPGRPGAEADALAAARRIGAARTAAVVVDMAPRPNPFAAAVAAAMGARYLPLPTLEGATVNRAVRETLGAS